MRRPLVAIFIPLLGLLLGGACKGTATPTAGSAQSATAMGHWSAWQDLTPLLEVTKNHVAKPTQQVLEQASALLREGKAKSADRALAGLADSEARHWISVARADLAALHFTVCIRGIAWRLEDTRSQGPLIERAMDYSPKARVQPGDVSIEALLTNLDHALASQVPALTVQARVARARVSGYTSRCPPNPEVQQRAEAILEGDLATLAAEGHLTPDLAFVWGGIQMNRYSSTAARPFFLQAREGGLDDPSVTYMLAVVALDNRELDEAEKLAIEAGEAFGGAKDPQRQAQVAFLRGEIARARKDMPAARKHVQTALNAAPNHLPAILAMTEMTREAEGDLPAQAYLHGSLRRLLLAGDLDEQAARDAAANVEGLVMLCDEPYLAQLTRDALLHQIESEGDPMRRGIRYYFAATLDARLREYESAQGHAVLARQEFEQLEVHAPVDVEGFLEQLRSAG